MLFNCYKLLQTFVTFLTENLFCFVFVTADCYVFLNPLTTP
nr:MAG TPA: hypothetical protein [Caudoviricetes sp.]